MGLELVILIDACLFVGLLFASDFCILSVPGAKRVLLICRCEWFTYEHLDFNVSLLLVDDGVWTDHCAVEIHRTGLSH